ncbi:nitrate reductase subunit alpha, partial [Paraburkholderia sp. SIMBA_053]
VQLKEKALADGRRIMVPDRYLRADDFNGVLGQDNNPEWKTVAFNVDGKLVLPNGSIGFRWGAEGRGDAGRWNLEAKEARHGAEVKLKLSVAEDGAQAHEVVTVGFPYFGGIDTPHFTASKQA